MKEFDKEILATIFFSFLLSITLVAEISLILPSELWISIYLILLSIWVLYKKISGKLFYYLSMIFFPLLIIVEPLSNYELTNNIAIFVFYSLLLSLVFKFMQRTE